MRLAVKIFAFIALAQSLSLTQGKLEAPTVKSVSVTHNSATITFEEVRGGTFDIQVATDEKMLKRVPGASGRDVKLTIGSLESSTTYYYEATVTVDRKESKATNVDKFTTATAPREPPWYPSRLVASATSETNATLSWAPARDADDYEWQVYDKDFAKLLFEGKTNSTSDVVSGLSGGTTYQWRVRAHNSAGYSPWVNSESSFVTPVSKPEPPSRLDIVSKTATGVSLSWSAGKGAESYDVNILNSTSFQTVKSANVKETSESFDGLSSSTTYFAQVYSRNSAGPSETAIQKEFKTDPPPRPNPPDISVDASSNSAAFTFKEVSGAALYEVKLYDKQNNGTLKGSGSTTDASKPVTVTGLQSKTDYTYEATVTVGRETSDPTKGSFKTLEGAAVPKPPDVTVDPSSTSATFTFKEVAGAALYEVKLYDKQNNGVLKGSGSTTDASKPVTIGSLQSKTKYYYEATVKVGSQTSEPTQSDFTTKEASGSVRPPDVSVDPSSTSATFTFKEVSGAALYEVKLYDKQNNGALKGSGSTTDASKPVTIGSLQSKTKYYYEATVKVGSQTSEPTKSDFTTKESSGLVRPPDVSVVPSSNSASFTFKEVSGATSYQVKLYDKENRSDLKGEGSTTDASKPVTITGLQSKTEYFYDATVTVGRETSEPTKGSFKTLEGAAAPRPPEVRVEPFSTSADFKFEPVSGATLYEVKLYDRQNNGTLKGSGSTTDASKPVTISGLQSKTKYYYEATVAVGGKTSDETKGDFTTKESSGLVRPPEVSVVPSSNSASFTFKEVSGATSYHVKLYDKENRSDLKGEGSTTDASKPVTISGLQSKTEYFYDATVTVGRETSDPAKGSFKTNEASAGPQPPDVSVTTTSSTATFTFKNVRDATLYKVLIYDEEPHGNKKVIPIDSGSTSDASKPVVISRLKSKSKYFYDATVTVGREESDPASDTFQTKDGSGGGDPPEVSVRTTSSSATFTFKEVRDATLYKVLIYDEVPHGNKKVAAIDSGSTTDASKPVVISRLKGKTKYYYDATVVVGREESEPTSDSFETSAGSGIEPPVVSVRTTSSTATFTFKEVRDAKLYKVLIYDKEPHGNNKVVPIDSDSTADASKPIAFSRLKGKTKYFYDATVTVGREESDPTSDSFETLTGSGIEPPVVSVRTTSSTATFTFKEVRDAKYYKVLIYDTAPHGNSKLIPIASDSSEDASKPVVFSRLKGKTKYYYDATVVVGREESEPTSDSFETSAGSGIEPPVVSVRTTSSTATFTFKEVRNAKLYKVLLYDKEPKGNNKVVPIDSGSTEEATKPVVFSRLKSKSKYFYDATVTVGREESDPASDSFETSAGSGIEPPVVSVRTTSTTATFTFKEVRDAKLYKVLIYDKEPKGNNKVVPIDSGTTQEATKPVVISRLKGKTKYFYDATVTVGREESDPASDSFETSTGSGIEPPAVSVRTTSSTATFTFKEVRDAKLYKVLIYDKEPHGNSKVIPIDSGSTEEATKPVVISRLKSKTKYYYEATVTIGREESDPADDSFETTGGSGLPGPQVSVRTTSSTATFTFKEVQDAKLYKVLIYDKNNQGNSRVVPIDSGSTEDASKPVTITGLRSKTKYYFDATAIVAGSETDPVNDSFETTDGSGGKRGPEVKVVPGPTSAIFTFTLVAGATSYDVRVYDQNSNGQLVGKGSTADPAQPVTIAGLQAKTKYYYEATVTVEGETSSPTGDSFTTEEGASRPSPPRVTTTTSPTTITFTFSPVAGATSYDVKLYDQQNNGNLIGSGSTNDAAKPVTITGLQSKTKYYYDATVTVGGLTSDPESGSFTTDEAGTPPRAPGVSVGTTINSVSFTFVAVAGATSYDIRVLDRQNNGNLIGSGSTNNAGRSVDITGLISKTTYFFEATVTVAGLTSEPSRGSFTTEDDAIPPPAAPRFSTIVTTSTTVSFTFSPVQGAVSYDVSVYDKQSGGTLLRTGATQDASRPVGFTGLQSSTRYFYEASVTTAGGSSEVTKGSFQTQSGTAVSDVELLTSEIPNSYWLGNNYPNPFNPSTKIEFSIPKSAHVRVHVYSSLGIQVSSLVDGLYSPGRYLVTWDASSFPSGVYFYRIATKEFAQTRRLLLVK